MTLVNHLRDLESQNLFHTVAYGKHVVTGHLTKSIVTGSSPTHVITLQHMLGRGEWDGCEGLWWNGTEIKSDKYKLYRGKQAPVRTLKNYTADSSTDVITSAAHGYANGDEVLVMPGDLPAPLAVDTVYYVRDVTTNTFKLAATSGGAAINLTSNGTGTLKLYKNDPDQGVDAVFSTDTPHNNIAWIRAELGTGFGDFDTKGNPPVGLRGIFRTSRVADYDDSGGETSYGYSTSPARQVADLILQKGGRSLDRIDWLAWCAWRDFLGEQISHDYTAIAGLEGFGLTGRYYNGLEFETFVSERVDPVLDFVSSAGSPGVGVNADNFTVRWDGFVKPQHTETYTFHVTHTHGVRVKVNGTLIIDEWASTGTHTGTAALTAGNYYEIIIEWRHATGNAELRLEWSSLSQKKEVISHRALYPRTVNRPRYETHPFFPGPTRLDDAVRTILNLCNSTVQEVDGKLVFFCLEQLTVPSFNFTSGKIVDGSLSIIPRDIRNLRNSWQVRFRDIDSQYLEFPIDPLINERADLIDVAGRKIDGEAIELFNCSVHQAYRTLDNIVRRNVDSKYLYQFTGMPDTFPVLAGDRTELEVEFLDVDGLDTLVLESNDASSEETADERIFTLQEWPDYTVWAAAIGGEEPGETEYEHLGELKI